MMYVLFICTDHASVLKSLVSRGYEVIVGGINVDGRMLSRPSLYQVSVLQDLALYMNFMNVVNRL